MLNISINIHYNKGLEDRNKNNMKYNTRSYLKAEEKLNQSLSFVNFRTKSGDLSMGNL